MVIDNFELEVAHLRGEGRNAWHRHIRVAFHFAVNIITVNSHGHSSRLSQLPSSHQRHQPTTPQYNNPHLPRIQWLRHPLKIRVNHDEPLVLTTAADVLMAEGARVAQSQHLFPHILHQVALRQMQRHPQKTEKTSKMAQLYQLKWILSRTRARNRICVGSAQNLLNIMRSRSATTGRAMSVRYVCVRCTKSWTVHSARCALCLPLHRAIDF